MRIGIDARLIKEKGLGRYIRNLLYELQEIDKKNEYFIFLLRRDVADFSFNRNFTKVVADFRWYTIKEQTQFPKVLSKLNLDLLHVPHFNAPIFFKGKTVVTIHDLIHQHVDTKHASTLNPVLYRIKRAGYKKVFSAAVNRSSKIITVSRFVKKQLEQEWGIDSKKIVVTYEGIDKSFGKKESKEILQKYNIKPPFIFYVGNAHPHKNIEALVKGFVKLRQNYQDLQLVLVGDDDFFWPKLRRTTDNKDIIFTGKVSDEELTTLYKNAQAFVTASLEEGFGLPILEAFSLGCPVVSSNKGSLPEIGGEAASYFDPNNLNQMIEKISEVLNNNNLRAGLVERGKKRASQFSWKKMAEETLRIYKSV